MEQYLQQQIRSVRIIHIALMSGAVFFILVSAYMVSEVGGFIEADERFTNTLLAVYNVLTFAAIPAGLWFFKRKTSGIANLGTEEKLMKYRLAMIIRSATIEGPCFFFIVGFIMTGSMIFLIEALACLLLLAYFFPTRGRLQTEIQIEVLAVL